MPPLDRAINHLVAANKILANEGVIDAYGHVSARHPDRADRFLLSRSLSPQFVNSPDILEFDLDGVAIDPAAPASYIERFIHAAIYSARPDINAIVHAHTESVLPFTISTVPLTAVVQSASDIGATVPVWEIRDRFGENTNLLVTDADKGRDLASTLGPHSVVLLRGHGFAAGAATLPVVVRMVVYLAQNARVQTIARSMGDLIPLSPGEIEAQRLTLGSGPNPPGVRRSWEYFAERAHCSELIAEQ